MLKEGTIIIFVVDNVNVIIVPVCAALIPLNYKGKWLIAN